MDKKLPFVIAKEYSLFIGRDAGIKILNQCLDHLGKISPDAIVPISFKNVKFMDFSAADEFIRKLISRITGKEYKNIYICFTDVADIVKENIEAALKLNQQVALLWNANHQPELIGVINTQLKDTWNLVNNKKTLTARDLADTMNLPINTSSNRLVKLYTLGLIHQADKKGASGGGQEYVYESVTL